MEKDETKEQKVRQEFPTCKVCGDTRTVMSELMKVKTDKPVAMAFFLTNLSDKPPALVNTPQPAVISFIDACFKCGTIRMVRQEDFVIPAPQAQMPNQSTPRNLFTGRG